MASFFAVSVATILGREEKPEKMSLQERYSEMYHLCRSDRVAEAKKCFVISLRDRTQDSLPDDVAYLDSPGMQNRKGSVIEYCTDR